MKGRNWEEERYVRLHTRDDAEWLAVTWQGRGLWALIKRKADRDGRIRVGKAGLKALAALVSAPWLEIDRHVRELVEFGFLDVGEEDVAIPEFRESEEADLSPAARMRKYRERLALGLVETAPGYAASRERYASTEGEGGDVTPRIASVTPSLASPSDPSYPSVPCRAPEPGAHTPQVDEVETPEPVGALVAPAPGIASTARAPLSKEAAAIRDEIAKHPSLVGIAAPTLADTIAGAMMPSGRKLSWVLAAIGEAVAAIGADEAAGIVPTTQDRSRRVLAFCKNARAPKEVEIEEEPRPRGFIPKDDAPDPMTPEEAKANLRVQKVGLATMADLMGHKRSRYDDEIEAEVAIALAEARAKEHRQQGAA